MKSSITALAVIACGLGAGAVYLQRHNMALSQELALRREQCGLRITALNAGYRAEIDDLRRYVLEQYNRGPAVKSEAKPRFDRLVSHGHRVRAVRQKYDFLLETALIGDAEKKKLLGLLLERERIANQVDIAKLAQASTEGMDLQRLQTDLDTVESQIQVLLQDPLDYRRYEVLRQREL